jgi:hypothetical protein
LPDGRSKAGDARAGRPLGFSLRGQFLSWIRVVLAAAVVAVIMAVSGAFGSASLGVATRTGYYLFLFASGAAMGVFVAARLLPQGWFEDRRWLAGATIVAAICLPMTALVVATNAVLHHHGVTLAALVTEFPSTTAITVAMTALAFLTLRTDGEETHAAPPGAEPPKFLSRLPQRLRGADLWAVEAEDHYLRLHTSLGQDLILLRLGDAIAELEGIEGARTHRSWWVARTAVRGAERADGRATLTLEGGVQAPVSRAYLKGLRDAGWF